MAGRASGRNLREIIDVLEKNDGALSARQIHAGLDDLVPLRTLQHRLRRFVETGRLVREGKGRASRYIVASEEGNASGPGGKRGEKPFSVSEDGSAVQKYLEQAPQDRKTVGYDRAFLDSYRPNETFYLSDKELERLHEIGNPGTVTQPAGSHAREIFNRFLVDLSWNSSRLEGNTYSFAETRRLVDFDQGAEGKNPLEEQMILNHKSAVEFLVSGAEEIGLNRYTILNLHAILADNLLSRPDMLGRLRRTAVGIEKTVFRPLQIPEAVEECFDQILAVAETINDPFEKSLFIMAQLPYLQPFDDVNKRTSRLSANIPLIKANLSPLSFEGVPKSLYIQGILGVYELNNISLLKDVFIQTYERSAKRYAIARQVIGEPDPLKFHYRDQLHEVIRDIILKPMGRKDAVVYIDEWTYRNITAADRKIFRETVETEILSVHGGNSARYRIRKSEFEAWQEVWSSP